MNRSKIPVFSLVTWAIIVIAGVFELAKYEATPGIKQNSADKSAVRSVIELAPSKMALVMFVHPRCPCSAASIEELSWLMAHTKGRLQATVMVFQPSGEPDDWSRTASWRSASGISGVVVRSDVDGMLARKCGAQTSGQVFLYDTNGSLVFEGGITGSRGHVGDNAGLDAVTALALGKITSPAPRAHSPVFGCAIYSNEDDASSSTLIKGR